METMLEVLKSLLELGINIIKNRSNGKRELKDSALEAIAHALNETSLYYRDKNTEQARDLGKEKQLVKYWSDAAIDVRHFDQRLSEICEHKSMYWINPERYSVDEIKEINIKLDHVREEYRKLLYPKRQSKKRP
jgi:hypothetical protein